MVTAMVGIIVTEKNTIILNPEITRTDSAISGDPATSANITIQIIKLIELNTQNSALFAPPEKVAYFLNGSRYKFIYFILFYYFF
jgi:hypothetical protein